MLSASTPSCLDSQFWALLQRPELSVRRSPFAEERTSGREGAFCIYIYIYMYICIAYAQTSLTTLPQPGLEWTLSAASADREQGPLFTSV